MINLAIVEDNSHHVAFIHKIINGLGNYQVIFEATDGFEFIKYCGLKKLLPDIVLVDVEMDVMDGISLTDYLNNYYPQIRVVGFSSHCNKEVVEDMFACGAKAYVFKVTPEYSKLLPSSFRLGLIDAIDAVFKGHYYLDKFILQGFDEPDYMFNPEKLISKRVEEKKSAEIIGLTKAETKLSALYATSTKNQKQIADALSISRKTVDAHVQSVSNKMKVKNRHSFALRSISMGLVKIARFFDGK